MKRLLLVLSATMFAFAACVAPSNKQTGNDGDTVNVEVHHEPEVPVVKDTLRTPDLSLFNLQGPVEKINSSVEDGFNVSFDKQGRITSIVRGWTEYSISYDSSESGKVMDSEGHKVKRDKEGRVLSISAGSGCGEAPGFYFKYAKGHVSEYTIVSGECTGDDHYNVKATDEQGRITKLMLGCYDVDISVETTYTYTYTKFDEWGNWTERSYKEKNEVIEVVWDEEREEEREDVQRSSNSGVETRVITYYE